MPESVAEIIPHWPKAQPGEIRMACATCRQGLAWMLQPGSDLADRFRQAHAGHKITEEETSDAS